MNLKQAVVFAILMEHGDGIAAKSPDYIMEKLEACSLEPNPEHMLDMKNLAKFRMWESAWTRHLNPV